MTFIFKSLKNTDTASSLDQYLTFPFHDLLESLEGCA